LNVVSRLLYPAYGADLPPTTAEGRAISSAAVASDVTRPAPTDSAARCIVERRNHKIGRDHCSAKTISYHYSIAGTHAGGRLV